MTTLHISMDKESLRRIKNLVEFEQILQKRLRTAMELSLDELDTQAAKNMEAGFKNPTGDLRWSLTPKVHSPFEAELFTESPYAWRREEGFSGMTDSLGRYYAHDPGIHYMAEAIDFGKDTVQEIFQLEVDLALFDIGVA